MGIPVSELIQAVKGEIPAFKLKTKWLLSLGLVSFTGENMFDNEIKSAGFVMFWRNDERIDTLPLDTQGFYFQLVRLVCHADGAKSYDGKPLLTGQYGTSLARISDRFNLTIRQVRTHFKRLSDAKIIESKSDTRKTIITICNYSAFHQNNKDDRHTKRQATDTPNDKPPTHIEEEGKELKELKETISPLSPLSKEGTTHPVSKAKKKIAQEDNTHFVQSKAISEELKQYVHTILTEEGYCPTDSYIQKEFRKAMRWHEVKGSVPKAMKQFLNNWFLGQYSDSKEEIQPKQTVDDLTPEEKERWARYQEKKRRQENYED